MCVSNLLLGDRIITTEKNIQRMLLTLYDTTPHRTRLTQISFEIKINDLLAVRFEFQSERSNTFINVCSNQIQSSQAIILYDQSVSRATIYRNLEHILL